MGHQERGEGFCLFLSLSEVFPYPPCGGGQGVPSGLPPYSNCKSQARSQGPAKKDVEVLVEHQLRGSSGFSSSFLFFFALQDFALPHLTKILCPEQLLPWLLPLCGGQQATSSELSLCLCWRCTAPSPCRLRMSSTSLLHRAGTKGFSMHFSVGGHNCLLHIFLGKKRSFSKIKKTFKGWRGGWLLVNLKSAS